MPGFRPKRKQSEEHQQNPEPQENRPQLDFSYLKMRAPNGVSIYAMTFEQIIEFVDEITDTLGPGEESAMFHLNQIRRILRRYIKYGDGNPD